MSTTGAEADIRKLPLDAPTIVLALLVTALVCLEIVIRWRAYDWFAKLDAAVLVINLVAVPPVAVWRMRAGKKTLGFQ